MLSINSRPAARIYIDGADLGDTPKLNHQVSEGQHSVLLQIPSGDTVKADSLMSTLVREKSNLYLWRLTANPR